MKRLFSYVILAAPAIWVLSAAFGQGPVDPVKKEWNDRYGALSNSIMNKDTRTVRLMAAPDAVWKLQGGARLNLNQAMADYAKKLNALKPNTQFTINCTKFTITPDKQALIERTQIISGFYKDAGGKRHQGFDGSAWRDTWLKTAKGWVLKSCEQANQMLTVDGKPGSPYAPAARK